MADSHSATFPPPVASSSSTAIRDPSGASSSSTPGSSRVPRQEESRSHHPRSQSPGREQHNLSVIDWTYQNASSVARDDSWSCIVVLFTFWFFVSMTMILGVYGSMNLLLGPSASLLLQPNPIFVQYIKVESLDSKPGVMLYGTYGTPALDVFTIWTETRNVTVPSEGHEEWKYYLNEGSQVNISYRMSSESPSIVLVIAEGDKGLSQWLDYPSYPKSTLSWNIIHGAGMITQDIFSSSNYYLALGNLNEEEAEVELIIRVRAAMYNTTDAYYKCNLTSDPCGLSVFFPDGNAAVLTSPGPQQNTSTNQWYIKLSYGPRWVTYIFGMGGLTLLIFLAFNYLNKLHYSQEDSVGVRHEGTVPLGVPLLSHKDDDLSSLGSSYESMSQDEEDLSFLTGDSINGKSLADGETGNNTRRLCAICFDAPRDCFFLPCGHCVACFECATRLAEADGTCPVCRRNMKKVRKIFTV
ncbi:E3 ubiquitin-protein ligase APD2-like [Prosopis cineraria]|uniref:E3 ubiquitin-protein ligase APD2-like n=1 Tax=Prosopis cineraria TaxID=364024 RepID=UPI00240F90FC|nr:E3 ubiquitin-protein ligase APD2-like [Prosopis cineraria]